ncbi:MAG: WhiB family transcriptional regulator [Nocardioidaceae bacterium]
MNPDTDMTFDLDRQLRRLGLPALVFTPDQAAAIRAGITPGWRQQAACADEDPDAWFPLDETDPALGVLATCDTCPVRRSCLATGLLSQERGIWASTTTVDRDLATDLIATGTPADVVVDQLLTPSEREGGEAA